MIRLAAALLLAAIGGCGKSLEYRDEAGQRCCEIHLPAGSHAAAVKANIQTDRTGIFERRYPILTIEYITAAVDARNLHRLSADIRVAGNLLEPASTELRAGYFDSFTTHRFAHELPPADCCERLDLRIQNDAASYSGDYGPVRFGIQLRKDYANQRGLPEKMELLLRVMTTQGSYESATRLDLVSYESTGAPVRFH